VLIDRRDLGERRDGARDVAAALLSGSQVE